MSKWVEQAAFETNEFKKGDALRSYCAIGGIERCDVTSVSGDIVYSGDSEFHFKQCRLLKQVKPREWWVWLGDISVIEKLEKIVAWTEKGRPDLIAHDGYKWIKVREVLEDEV